MGRSTSTTVAVALRLLLFAAIGLLVGWMIGGSQSPAVGPVLPALIGLIGGYYLSTGPFGYRSTPDMNREAQPEQRGDRPRLTLTVALLLLVGACYVGARIGMAARAPDYPSIEVMLGTTPQGRPEAVAYVYKLRWILQHNGVPPAEAQSLFRSVVAPAMAADAAAARDPSNSSYDATKHLTEILDVFSGSSTNWSPGGPSGSDNNRTFKVP